MKTRFLHAIYALLAAWGAGMLSTIGEQVVLCWRNADKDIHIFWQLFPLVLMIWSIWTFCISLARLGYRRLALGSARRRAMDSPSPTRLYGGLRIRFRGVHDVLFSGLETLAALPDR